MGQIPNGALATGWLEGSVTEVGMCASVLVVTFLSVMPLFLNVSTRLLLCPGVSASPAMKPASMLAYQGPVIVDSSQGLSITDCGGNEFVRNQLS